jgi:hypothetical protein
LTDPLLYYILNLILKIRTFSSHHSFGINVIYGTGVTAGGGVTSGVGVGSDPGTCVGAGVRVTVAFEFT